MLNYFPKYFTSKAIYLYLGVLLFCSVLFFSKALPLMFMALGIVEVLFFFYFSNLLTKKWAKLPNITFTKRLFSTALIIRLVWVIFSYAFYMIMTGQPFEFGTADAIGYHEQAEYLASLIHQGNTQSYFVAISGHYSDMGYSFYLGWIYWATGKSILVARILKALYGAYMCVLIYRLATRNFGEAVGRMSAIFCLLMPNLIYYTGLHLKETEMVFLTVWFMERADYLLRSKKYNFINIAAPIALAVSLFSFRTVLGATALFALLTAIIFSSTRVMGMGKRILIFVWLLIAIGYFVGGKISTEIENVWATKDKNQGTSMNWRSNREGGNKFAKYASGAVFIPAILIIPFPTIINTSGQENLQLINGGNFVKNIMAFFVIFALLWIIKNKKWRDYILIGSFTIGYLLVLAMSAFAQSERFHQPALPFLLIFAAFGLSHISNKEKIYFTFYRLFIFIAIVGWSWYKLAGRGLV